MQYSVAAVLAFAGAALAQTEGFDPIYAPATGDDVQAGETFTITWEAAPSEYDEETVDIILMAGDDPTTLVLVEPAIAEGVVNSEGSYEWEVPADLGDDATYGIKIQLSSDPSVFQYSEPFAITPSEGGEDEEGEDEEDEDEDEIPIPTGNSTVTATPSSTASSEGEEETGESSSVVPPKTTLTTTTDEPEASATGPVPTVNTAGAASHASAGAFAVVGGLAIALAAL